MRLGRPVEHGTRQAIFRHPRHPYTKALLASTSFVGPDKRAERVVLKGELPSPLNPPPGLCVPQAVPVCDGCVQRGTPGVEGGRWRAIMRR